MRNTLLLRKATGRTRFLIPARLALFFALSLTCITAYSQNPVLKVFPDWEATTGSQNMFQRSVTRTITATTDVVVAGATINSNGNYDILVQRLSGSGSVIWSQQYNGPGNGNDMASDVRVATNGEVYVCGTYYKDATDSSNAIVIKYSANGTQRWVATYNGSGSRNDGYSSLLVSGASVVAVGATWGTSSQYDMLTRRLDTAGTTIWTTTADQAGLNDGAVSLTSASGAVFVTGGVQTSGTSYKIATWKITASTGAITTTTLSSNSSISADRVNDVQEDASGNVYVAGTVYNMATGFDFKLFKYNAALSLVWSATWNGAANLDDGITGLAIDAHNNVIVTGYTGTASQGKDYATVKYNSAGTLQWARTYDGGVNANDSATAIVVGDTNHIFVTGYMYNGATNDYYTIRYDASGNVKWNADFNSVHNANDIATAIALDTLNNVVVTGQNKINDTTRTYTTTKYVEKNMLLTTDTTVNISNSFVFTDNRGQLYGTNGTAQSQIRYYTINGNRNIYFMDTAVSFVLAKIDTSSSHNDTLRRVDMKYKGANADVRIRAADTRADYYNFFTADVPDGRSRVQNHNQLVSFNAWNNVDIVYGSNLSGLKTYFLCKPGGGGASYLSIDLKFTGADSVRIDGSGQLVIYTRLGRIVSRKAQAWQIDNSGNFVSLGWQPSYNLVATNEVMFNGLGTYNNSYTLVFAMDWGNDQPQSIQNIEWSTYYGGTGNDVFNDSKTDAAANLYVTGWSNNNSFPTVNAFQGNMAGSQDVVTGKFFSDGQRAWMTFFGGSNYETGNGIAVDPSGNVFTTGTTVSGDFPPYPAGGSSYFQIFSGGSYTDAFIFKLAPSGQTCAWSTYYGGSGSDQANAIECDPSGNIFITGETETNDFPTQFLSGAYNQSFAGPTGSDRDAFIVKFNHTTLDNVWATYLGGNSSVTEEGRDIAIDASGNIAVVGTTESSNFPTNFPAGSYSDNSLGGGGDGFIARFNTSCAKTWATYYGGSTYEKANGVVFDPSGDIYVVGRTSSTDLPTLQFTGGYWQPTKGTGNDAYMLKFSGSTFARQWATYYGGSGADEGYDLATDAYGNIYVAGYAGNGFPFPSNPSGTYTGTYQGGTNGDAFVGSFNHGSLVNVWGSYVGSTGDDVGNTVSSDVNGKLFLLGSTQSGTTFPLDNGGGVPYYQGTFGGSVFDGYITRFALSPVLHVNEVTPDNNGLSVYPNPTSNQLFVTYNGLKGNDLKFTVYNMLGETVRTIDVGKTYGTASYAFDLTDIASGVYFVQAECDGQMTSKKFIKQ